MIFATLATGLLQICLPLELRQLRASPNEIGLTLSMFGFGMFAFEGLWGVVADRIGYRVPLVASQVLYGGFILLLARAESVVLIAAGYFLASGMMVAVGPIARSYLGTALHARLRATGLALLSAQWVFAAAVGSGVGGQLFDHFPIRSILYAAALLPVVSAALIFILFRGYSPHKSSSEDDAARLETSRDGGGVLRVLLVSATMVFLIEIGSGGEVALLPLLVTNHLNLSAADAGTAMLVVGLLGGALLVPGGSAADRWGRKPTMIAGGLLTAAGFAVYATAGNFGLVMVGAALRASGTALIWPAATAWFAESMPRNRHAFYMGLFGEFESLGVTIGPILGGLVWSIAGIQSAFVAFSAAGLAAGLIAALMVARRAPLKTVVVGSPASPVH
jgi:MFS family permease